MDLDEYIFYEKKENPSYTKAQFASELGIPMAALRAIMQRKAMPSASTAIRIDRITNGKVDGWMLINDIYDKLEEEKAGSWKKK